MIFVILLCDCTVYLRTFTSEKGRRSEGTREDSSDDEEVERVVEKKQKRPSSPPEDKVKCTDITLLLFVMLT